MTKNIQGIGLWVALTLTMAALSGCGASKKPPVVAAKKSTKRYKIEQDVGPEKHERIPDLSKIPNAVPKNEPKSRIGNPKTYTVFNKTYSVMPHAKGYKARGVASWYGKKFHGYHTSNGEVYDMYGMSAAHKTLPLPTYVKVTNLRNGKHVIVKVNDRGPFHEDRLIDLSYAAANKLGILATGTGMVEIQAIDSALGIGVPQLFLQVGNFTVEQNAKKLAAQLQKVAVGHEVTVRRSASKRNKSFHVHIGPFDDEAIIDKITRAILKHKFPKPVRVKMTAK